MQSLSRPSGALTLVCQTAVGYSGYSVKGCWALFNTQTVAMLCRDWVIGHYKLSVMWGEPVADVCHIMMTHLLAVGL